MKNHRLIKQRFAQSSKPSDKKHWPLKILLALSIVVILAGCYGTGGGGGYYGSRGYYGHGGGYYGHRGYSPGGFSVGGAFHGQHFGGQHSFGHSGFGHGGFGHGIGH